MAFKEECGVFGIYGHSEAANLTYLGLYALQHRGQESVGIATSDGGGCRSTRRSATSPTASTRPRSSGSRARAPSATCGIPRPARAASRTPSRS